MSLMGELTYFLGLQIKKTRESIFLSQIKYALELLKKFDMQDCKWIRTPMESTLSIDKDESGIEVDGKRYRGMIRSLLYLTASRPDIMFSACMCARYQAFPNESHLKIVKRILKWNYKFWFVISKGKFLLFSRWWCKSASARFTEVVIRVSFRQGVMNSINFQQWLENSFEL